jgi:ActR/RegA family two-component response regulator
LIFNRGAPIAEDEIRQAFSETDANFVSSPAQADEVIRLWARDILKGGEQKNLLNTCMDRIAGILIGEALKMTGGNRSRTARLLGLSRPTLNAKIEKYNLQIETSVTKK